jgi:hypothetical protein
MLEECRHCMGSGEKGPGAGQRCPCATCAHYRDNQDCCAQGHGVGECSAEFRFSEALAKGLEPTCPEYVRRDRRRVIAVDFDGTITLPGAVFPEIGAPNIPVLARLLRAKLEGALLILWTCRSGEDLNAAVDWCGALPAPLLFDAVNDNLPENKLYFGNNSRKVYADECWDDKSSEAWRSD